MGLSSGGALAQNSGGAMSLGQAPGSPAGSYSVGDFDTVNLFNGHLNFRLPLTAVGGRGGAGYTVPFVYQQRWIVEHYYDAGQQRNIYYPTDNWRSDLEPGFSPGVMRGYTARFFNPDACPSVQNYFTSPETLSYLTFTGPDGTQYNLYSSHGRASHQPCSTTPFNRGKVFRSADGSAATFLSDNDIVDQPSANYPSEITISGHLFLRDGTRYKVEGGRVTEVRDRNGNKLVVAYGGFGVSTITDSLNRQVSFVYEQDEGAPYGTCTVIILKGTAGADRRIRISSGSLNSALRPGLTNPNPDYNPVVPTSVWLPDGRRYRLYYNDHAEMARVELPTGGAVEYDHEGGLQGGDPEGIFEGGFDGVGGNRIHIYRRSKNAPTLTARTYT